MTGFFIDLTSVNDTLTMYNILRGAKQEPLGGISKIVLNGRADVSHGGLGLVSWSMLVWSQTFTEPQVNRKKTVIFLLLTGKLHFLVKRCVEADSIR